MSDYRRCDRCGKLIQVGQIHLCDIKEAVTWTTCSACGHKYPYGSQHICPTTVGR